ncbi:sugar phosphate nucleotidyltransferase, partial [Amylibacter sp.]|nr:sugar phosphate nucleotidyltransferase [Amylibacter sp.]
KIVKIIPNNVKISSVRQADALGLGHAILCAKHLIKGEPFAVLLPDVLVLDKQFREKNFSFIQLINAWKNTGTGQVMVEQVDHDEVEKYGIVDLGAKKSKSFESVSLKGLIEKPDLQDAPSNLAILGRYILPPNSLDLLENIKPGVGGEIQLTDALDVLLKSTGLNALETDADIYDCGNKFGYLSANLAVGMRDTKSKASIIAEFNRLTADDE